MIAGVSEDVTKSNEAGAGGASFDRGISRGEHGMKHTVMLTIASLLSILLFTFHVTDDIVRGFESGRAYNLTAIPIFVVWMYGTLVLAERRSGYIITLLGSLLSLAVPVLHMTGKGVGGEIAKSTGAFFFIWTIIALGVTAAFSVILSVHALFSMWRRSRVSTSGPR